MLEIQIPFSKTYLLIIFLAVSKPAFPMYAWQLSNPNDIHFSYEQQKFLTQSGEDKPFPFSPFLEYVQYAQKSEKFNTHVRQKLLQNEHSSLLTKFRVRNRIFDWQILFDPLVNRKKLPLKADEYRKQLELHANLELDYARLATTGTLTGNTSHSYYTDLQLVQLTHASRLVYGAVIPPYVQLSLWFAHAWFYHQNEKKPVTRIDFAELYSNFFFIMHLIIVEGEVIDKSERTLEMNFIFTLANLKQRKTAIQQAFIPDSDADSAISEMDLDEIDQDLKRAALDAFKSSTKISQHMDREIITSQLISTFNDHYGMAFFIVQAQEHQGNSKRGWHLALVRKDENDIGVFIAEGAVMANTTIDQAVTFIQELQQLPLEQDEEKAITAVEKHNALLRPKCTIENDDEQKLLAALRFLLFAEAPYIAAKWYFKSAYRPSEKILLSIPPAVALWYFSKIAATVTWR